MSRSGVATPVPEILRFRDKADVVTNRTLLILDGPQPIESGDDRHAGATLAQIRKECAAVCEKFGMDLEIRQADDSDQMLDWIATDGSRFDALILSPAEPPDSARYRAALEAKSVSIKLVIEVHPGNVFLDDGAGYKPLQGPEGETGFVCGFGLQGYLVAIRAIANRLQH